MIIVDEIVSADGFAARAGGAIDFFEDREDVVSSVGSPERMTQVSAVLLGATTYREFSDYWPGQSPAASVNRLPKHVLSNNLAIAPWGDLQPATVERGDAATVTRRLAGQYPGDIIVVGKSLGGPGNPGCPNRRRGVASRRAGCSRRGTNVLSGG